MQKSCGLNKTEAHSVLGWPQTLKLVMLFLVAVVAARFAGVGKAKVKVVVYGLFISLVLKMVSCGFW